MAADNPNKRISHIRRFLAAPPRGYAGMRVYCQGSPPDIVLTLQGPCTPQLAEDVQQAMLDYVEDEELTRETQFAMVWLDEHEKHVGTPRTVRVRPETEKADSDNALEQVGQIFDGSDQSRLIQLQRHDEARLRMHYQWTDRIITRLTETVEDLTERLGNLEGGREAARNELFNFKMQVADPPAEGDEPEQTGLSQQTQDQLGLVLEKMVIPLLMKKLMAAAGPNGPVPPNAPSG